MDWFFNNYMFRHSYCSSCYSRTYCGSCCSHSYRRMNEKLHWHHHLSWKITFMVTCFTLLHLCPYSFRKWLRDSFNAKNEIALSVPIAIRKGQYYCIRYAGVLMWILFFAVLINLPSGLWYVVCWHFSSIESDWQDKSSWLYLVRPEWDVFDFLIQECRSVAGVYHLETLEIKESLLLSW
jgi:hypothetical protein